MAYTLEQQIAECYRRAEESRRLYYRSSNLNERESYFITTMHLTRLADNLRSQLRRKDSEPAAKTRSRRIRSAALTS